MNKYFIFPLLLLSHFLHGQSITISGKVTDASTGEKLLFAECYDALSNNGAITNSYGYYSFSAEKGRIKLVVSYLGYIDYENLFELTKDSIINIALIPETELLDEVVLNKTVPLHKQTLMGKISVPVNTIKAIPSFAGEPDLMKSLTYLPGVSNGKEAYSNIFVRGGDRGQNLILLDGIKLYNTNHVGGFLSLVNSRILKNVDVYKGGFPARYGGRASSVIDIYTKDGDVNSFKGNANIGLLTSSFLTEGPLKKNVSFYLAARSSYFELFSLKKKIAYLRKQTNEYWGYTLFDINAKINWQLSETNNLSLSYYTGHDYQISASQETEGKLTEKMKIHNSGISLNYHSKISSKLFLSNQMSFSNYANVFEDNRKYETNYFSSSDLSNINDFSFRSQLEYTPNIKNHITLGIEGSYYLYTPYHNKTVIQDETNSLSSEVSDELESVEASAFVEDDIELSKKAKVNIGLRQTYYSPKDTSFYRLEPRLSFRWLISSKLSFKANYTRMNQYNHSLVNNVEGLEKEIWFSATKKLIPQSADQVSIGLFYARPKENWRLSIESYYKKMNNLLEYFSPVEGMNLHDDIQDAIYKNGKGLAYGIETQIAKNRGRFRGNISYTLSWNNRQFQDLNSGRSYPFIYDRRHVFSLLSSIKLSDSYTITANFNLSSGSPVTMPVGFVNNDTVSYGYFIYDGLNNKSLPFFHRLDLSINRVRKNRKGKKRQISLNIFNVYARQNPAYVYYDRNNGKVKQVSLYSIIPTLNISYDF